MFVGMHEAKTQLSQLAKKVHEGETVIVTQNGKPYLEIKPIAQSTKKRPLGLLTGQITISDDFDNCSQEIEDMFYGESK